MTDTKQEMRVVTIRLSEDQHRNLKVALAMQGNTAQAMLSRHVDRYIETFGKIDREET